MWTAIELYLDFGFFNNYSSFFPVISKHAKSFTSIGSILARSVPHKIFTIFHTIFYSNTSHEAPVPFMHNECYINYLFSKNC